MNLRKLRWAIIIYALFDLYIGGYNGGFLPLNVATAAAQTVSLLSQGQIGVSCNAITVATSNNPGTVGGCTSLALVTSGGALPSVYTWQVLTTGSPASITVTLQGSLDGVTWTQLGSVGSAVTTTTTSVAAYRFLGCIPSTLSGGSSPTITCQISVTSGSGGGGGGGAVNIGTAGQIASYLTNGSTLSGTNKLIGTINPEAYGVLHDVQVIYDATWATGCAGVCTITSGAGDPCFVAGDVGKIEFGTNWNPSNQFYQASTVVLGQGTVSSFTDCHHIVVNTTPTANATANGVFAWGHDDATALAAAWTAATIGPQCQELLLPSGTMFTSTGQFNSAANCKFLSDAAGDTGSSVGGIANGGLRSTVIIPLPSLSISNSGTCNGFQGACFGGIQSGFNMHDFSIFGMGNGATGFGSSKTCLSFGTDVYFSHVECSWWGQSDTNFTGLTAAGGPDLFRVIINGAGAVNCRFLLSVQLWASYCNAGLTAVMVQSAGTVTTSFITGYGASGTGQPTQEGDNQISGTFRSYGDFFFDGSGNNNHQIQVFNGGSIYLVGSTISGTASLTGLRLGNAPTDSVFASIDGTVIKNTTNASFGMVLNGSGVRAVSRDSTYNAPVSGNQILSANSAVYQDMGGNSFTGAATLGFAAAGAYQGIQGITAVQGSCSGTATSSSTLGLYGAGENTALTCTSTTVSLGPTMTKNGTILGLLCSATHAGVNASSGAVTVLKNNAATTSTCTIGTGTSCTDQTHTSAYNLGDVLSVQFTTQTAEVLAGVACTVITN